jgi:hypothetical protein
MNAQIKIITLILLFGIFLVTGCQGAANWQARETPMNKNVNPHEIHPTAGLDNWTGQEGYYEIPGYQMSSCNLYTYVR